MIGQVQISLIVKQQQQQQHRRLTLSLLRFVQQHQQQQQLSARKSQLLVVPVLQQVNQFQSVTNVNNIRYYSTSNNCNNSSMAVNNNNNNNTSKTTPPTITPFGSNNNGKDTATTVSTTGSNTRSSVVVNKNNTNFIPIQHSCKQKINNNKICSNTNDLKTITKYILSTKIGQLYTYHNNINIVPVKKITTKIIQQFVATNDKYLAWTNPNIYTIIQLTEYILRGFSARIYNTIWNRNLHSSNKSSLDNVNNKVDIVTDTEDIITTIGIMIQLVQRLEQEGAHYMIQRNNFYEQIYGISPIRPLSLFESESNSSSRNNKEQQQNDDLLLLLSSVTSSVSPSFGTNLDTKIPTPVDSTTTTSIKQLETFILSLQENNFLNVDTVKNDNNNNNNDFNIFDDLYGTLRNRTDPFSTTETKETTTSSPDIAFNELLIELRHDKKQQQQQNIATANNNEESTTTTKDSATTVEDTKWLQEQLQDIVQNSSEFKRQHVLDTVQYKMKQLQYSIINNGSDSSSTTTDSNNSTSTNGNKDEEDDIQFIDPTLFQSTYVSDFAVPGPTVSMYDTILDAIACSAECIAKNNLSNKDKDIDNNSNSDQLYLLKKAQYIQKKVLQRYSHDINKFNYTTLTSTDKLNNTIYHYICPTIATFNTVLRTASNHAIGLYNDTTNTDAATNTNITNEQQMILRDTCLDVLLSAYIVLIEASEPCHDSTKLFCSVLRPDIASNSTSTSTALQLSGDTDTNNNNDDDDFHSDNEEEYKEEENNNEDNDDDDDDEEYSDDEEEEYNGIDNEYTTGGSIDTGIVRINTASYLYLLYGFNNILPSSYIKSNILHGLYKQAKDQRVLSNVFINEYKNIATTLQNQNYVVSNSNTEQTLRVLHGQRDPNIPNIPNHHWNDKISTTTTTSNTTTTTTNNPYQSLVKYKQNSKRLQYTSKDPTY